MPPLKIATTTASSRRRSEDRLAVHRIPDGFVVVVADGAGGIHGGAEAADLALRVVAEAIEYDAAKVTNPTWLVELLVHADVLVETARGAGETTCVVVVLLDDGRIVGASVGDSGAVIVTPDGSIDDLTEGQHRKRRLGSGRALPVAFQRVGLDGTLLVATDGLLAYARPAIIVRDHDDLDEAAEAARQAVRLPSGALQNDVAIVVIRRGASV